MWRYDPVVFYETYSTPNPPCGALLFIWRQHLKLTMNFVIHLLKQVKKGYRLGVVSDFSIQIVVKRIG